MSTDPRLWSVDQVVDALCSPQGALRSKYTSLSIHFAKLGAALKKNEIDGQILLDHVDHLCLENSLKLDVFAHRCRVQTLIVELQRQSPTYATRHEAAYAQNSQSPTYANQYEAVKAQKPSTLNANGKRDYELITDPATGKVSKRLRPRDLESVVNDNLGTDDLVVESAIDRTGGRDYTLVSLESEPQSEDSEDSGYSIKGPEDPEYARIAAELIANSDDEIIDWDGDSSETDDDTRREMEEDKRENEARKQRILLRQSNNLSHQQISAAIEEGKADIEEKWRLLKLPGLKQRANLFWRKSRLNYNLYRELAALESEEGRLRERLKKLELSILEETWFSKDKVIAQCANLDVTVTGIATAIWKQENLRAGTPPPVIPIQKKAIKPKTVLIAPDSDNDEEEITDEDDDDSFIEDDQEQDSTRVARDITVTVMNIDGEGNAESIAATLRDSNQGGDSRIDTTLLTKPMESKYEAEMAHMEEFASKNDPTALEDRSMAIGASDGVVGTLPSSHTDDDHVDTPMTEGMMLDKDSLSNVTEQPVEEFPQLAPKSLREKAMAHSPKADVPDATATECDEMSSSEDSLLGKPQGSRPNYPLIIDLTGDSDDEPPSSASRQPTPESPVRDRVEESTVPALSTVNLAPEVSLDPLCIEASIELSKIIGVPCSVEEAELAASRNSASVPKRGQVLEEAIAQYGDAWQLVLKVTSGKHDTELCPDVWAALVHRKEGGARRIEPSEMNIGAVYISSWFTTWIARRVPEKAGKRSGSTIIEVSKAIDSSQEFEEFYNQLQDILLTMNEEKNKKDTIPIPPKPWPYKDPRLTSQDPDSGRDPIPPDLGPSTSRRTTKPLKRGLQSQEAKATREVAKRRQDQYDAQAARLHRELGKTAFSNILDPEPCVNISKADDEESITIDRHIGQHLYPYQVDGVRFLWREIVTSPKMEGCLLAQPMGMGKTMQVIALLLTVAKASRSSNPRIVEQIPKKIRGSHTLVLCPATLVDNWMEEFARWVPLPHKNSVGIIRKISNAPSVSTRERIMNIEAWAAGGGILVMSYNYFRNVTSIQTSDVQEIYLGLSKNQREMASASLLELSKIVVCDEAQEIKSGASKLNQAAHRLRTSSRVAMSGSPLSNNLEEYYRILDFVAPSYLGPVEEFRQDYVNPITDGLYADATWYQKRQSLKMLSILKQEIAPKVHRADMSVLKDRLPGKTEFVIRVPLTDIQDQCYKLYVDSILRGDLGKVDEKFRAKIWAWMAILGLLCSHPHCFQQKLLATSQDVHKLTDRTVKAATADFQTDSEDNLSDNMAEEALFVPQEKTLELQSKAPTETSQAKALELESEALTEKPQAILDTSMLAEQLELLQSQEYLADPVHSHKMKLLFDILRLSKLTQEKVLVFSHNLATLDYVESIVKGMNFRYYRLDGSTTMGIRQSLTRSFNDGHIDVFLISTRAGGTGLNLYKASRVVILDDNYNPMHEQQAIGRAYRIGQKNHVYIYRLVVGGTLEDAMQNQALFKLGLANRIVDEKDVKRNATKGFRQWIFSPRTVQQQDVTSHIGKDPAVLDKILKQEGNEGCIRNILLADTFMVEENEPLTEEEKVQVAEKGDLLRLKREDPRAYDRKLNEIQKQRLVDPNNDGNQSHPIYIVPGLQMLSSSEAGAASSPTSPVSSKRDQHQIRLPGFDGAFDYSANKQLRPLWGKSRAMPSEPSDSRSDMTRKEHEKHFLEQRILEELATSRNTLRGAQQLNGPEGINPVLAALAQETRYGMRVDLVRFLCQRYSGLIRGQPISGPVDYNMCSDLAGKIELMAYACAKKPEDYQEQLGHFRDRLMDKNTCRAVFRKLTQTLDDGTLESVASKVGAVGSQSHHASSPDSPSLESSPALHKFFPAPADLKQATSKLYAEFSKVRPERDYHGTYSGRSWTFSGRSWSDYWDSFESSLGRGPRAYLG